MTKKKRLTRPREGRKVVGVCAGISEYLGIDVVVVRLVWVVLLIPGGLPGLLPYLAGWIIIPSE